MGLQRAVDAGSARTGSRLAAMPVLVTSAHRPLARRIALRLLQEGGEVRAYAAGDVSPLRAAGAIVASGEVDDEGRLEAAMAQVHTVVHVGGGLFSTAPSRLVRDANVVAVAATNAGVQRLISLSLPGAAAGADDPLRRAKAQVEEVFAGAGPPSVVIRSSLVDTPALRDGLATAGLGAEVLDRVEVAPVRVGDLVELVWAFDEARSRSRSGHLVVSADGPTRMTLRDYLARVGVAGPGGGGLVGRRLTDDVDAPLLRQALIAGPWWTEDPAVVDGWRFAGLHPLAPTT
jgi:uncharacterized protein YbjT (DUF2867 family)